MRHDIHMTGSFYDLMRNKFLNWITWSVRVMLCFKLRIRSGRQPPEFGSHRMVKNNLVESLKMHTAHVAGCLHNPVGQLVDGYLSGEGLHCLAWSSRDLAVCHHRVRSSGVRSIRITEVIP